MVAASLGLRNSLDRLMIHSVCDKIPRAEHEYKAARNN
jgi:hypothetical protein